MTLKEITEKLVKEIAEIEQYCDEDGHLPEKYCYWILCARTQRVAEISYGMDLSGTNGFERKGCYECTLGQPKCKAYQETQDE